ncbi:hypothetical protein OIU79_020356 [Salix purpurea]|uniref:Uncharacterized protein n=1 Tax=Salix purpurea TaxID=77065 RepID=A0A9Q0NUG9_SALPP|nr:hypothetical protein OIU79_020356 [Salix purpurea]
MHRALSLPSSRRGTSFYVCFPADSGMTVCELPALLFTWPKLRGPNPR